MRTTIAPWFTADATINAVNQLPCPDVGLTGPFMTLFYLVIDPYTRRLTWVRAGHDPAWLYDPGGGHFVELGGPGLPVGVNAEWDYQESRGKVPPGQVIIMTTDGV